MLCGDFKLMNTNQQLIYEKSLPNTTIDGYNKLFRSGNLIFYTNKEMVPCYQEDDDPLGRQLMLHSVPRDISGGNDFKGNGNGNKEYPWKVTAGLDSSIKYQTVKFFQLPQKTPNSVWPVIYWEEKLPRARQQTKFSSILWQFPIGTIFGECLYVVDSQNYAHCFEIRIRERDKDGWKIDVLRPFPFIEDLIVAISKLNNNNQYDVLISKLYNDNLDTYVMESNHPDRKAFRQKASVDVLPPMKESLVTELLDGTPFKLCIGQVWKLGDPDPCYAPTSNDMFGIVPKNYTAAWLEPSRDSCARCHCDVLRHVDDFDGRTVYANGTHREWYNRLRGSDGIFSWHPFSNSSISHNGFPLPVKFRQSFIDNKIIEKFDSNKHTNYIKLKGVVYNE